MQAPWASQFEAVATVVATTTNEMASAWLGDFAVTATVINLSDVGRSRRRTVVLTRVVGDAMVRAACWRLGAVRVHGCWALGLGA